MQITIDVNESKALRLAAKLLNDMADIQEALQSNFSAVPTPVAPPEEPAPPKPKKAKAESPASPAVGPSEASSTTSKPETVSESAPSVAGADKLAKLVTLEDVRAIAAKKSQGGNSSLVVEILKEFGVSKLGDVPPADYGRLITELEKL